MAIPFKSPKNIEPSYLGEALCRTGNGDSKHTIIEWSRICDTKEFYKLLVMSISSPEPHAVNSQSTFMLGLQIGFDLHAEYGDAGPAKLYEREGEKKWKTQQDRQKPKNGV